MTPRQIKENAMNSKRAFTTTEILISTFILIMIFACTFGAFTLVKAVSQYKSAEIALQQNANVIVSKIIRGYTEGGNIVGLRSAASFTIPAATPAGSKIEYVGKDGNTRSYFLSGNTIQYVSPAQSPNQQVVYTAMSAQSVTLRFWETAGSIDHETVGIYLSISQALGNRTASGSVSTYVNLRNTPK